MDTLRVFTLSVITSSLGGAPVKNAATIELNAGMPGRAAAVEARRWIERQLQWERTLGTLRGDRSRRERTEGRVGPTRSTRGADLVPPHRRRHSGRLPPSTVAGTASMRCGDARGGGRDVGRRPVPASPFGRPSGSRAGLGPEPAGEGDVVDLGERDPDGLADHDGRGVDLVDLAVRAGEQVARRSGSSDPPRASRRSRCTARAPSSAGSNGGWGTANDQIAPRPARRRPR